MDLNPGPAAALAYLCDLQDNNEESPPIGPIRFCGDTECFILVAAWTYGRQWFKMLVVFSSDEISDERAKALLAEHLPEASEDE